MFATRHEAGQKLARALVDLKGRNGIILAIPRGGIPIGYEVAITLSFPLDILPVRKVAIPWNPEAGFAAVAPGGILVLNEDIVPYLGLEEKEIKTLADKTLAEVKRRLKVYRGQNSPPDLAEKLVILVDDGLASGITMLAGLKMIKKKNPAEIVVASPVASGNAVVKIKPEVDRLVTLYTHPSGLPFAVASFYEEWYDLSDQEVKNLLKQAQKNINK